jgi:hypothetical protein
LHIRVVAPKEYRLTIAAERPAEDAKLAERTLEETDRNGPGTTGSIISGIG